MGKYNLDKRLQRIDEFFNNLSVDEFEEMAFDCGLGKIKKSSECNYVVAANIQYSNRMKKAVSTKDNQFSFVGNGSDIKGAA